MRNFSIITHPVFKYAIKIYKDPVNQRNLIRTENSGKVGVYS
jgi:hypothetical protein